MQRAVSFRLNDPGELLRVIKEASDYFLLHPFARPMVMMCRKTGALQLAFEIGRVRRRETYTLGSISRSLRGNALNFHGPFFVDCEDEVRDVCQQLGVRCVIRQK